MRSNRVAFRVLTNRSLFQSIVGFSSGVSYIVYQVKKTLVNSDQPEHIKLWQNAICSGDKRTLEAIKLLSGVKGLDHKLWQALYGLMAFAVTHTKDLELLEWLYHSFPDQYYHRSAFTGESEVIGEQGDIDIAKWAMSHEYFIDTRGAAKFGHLDLLTYLHEVGYTDFTKYTMDAAATNGHLDVVEFLCENQRKGCTNKAMDGAAKNGHLEVLKFLHEHEFEGCIGTAIKLAVENGRTKCVKYLFEVNSDGFVPREDLVNIAASNGHLEVIKYFHSNEYFRFSPRTMHNAAVANHLHLVKFLHENRTEGCKVDTLFECDKRELHRVVEYLLAHRPMKDPAKAIARAKREDRLLLAAKLMRTATAMNSTYIVNSEEEKFAVQVRFVPTPHLGFIFRDSSHQSKGSSAHSSKRSPFPKKTTKKKKKHQAELSSEIMFSCCIQKVPESSQPPPSSASDPPPPQSAPSAKANANVKAPAAAASPKKTKEQSSGGWFTKSNDAAASESNWTSPATTADPVVSGVFGDGGGSDHHNDHHDHHHDSDSNHGQHPHDGGDHGGDNGGGGGDCREGESGGDD